MTERISRKSLKHDEFLEAAFDLERWFEKNWRPVAAAAGALIAVTLLVSGWFWWSGRKAGEVAILLGDGLGKLEETGDPATLYAGALPSFEKAAREGAGSERGRAAAFLQAASLVRLGRASDAVTILEPLAREGGVVGDLARAKLAAALAAAGQTDRAVAAWKDLSSLAESTYPPDLALLYAAQLLEQSGRGDEAKAVIQDLLAKHPQGPANADAQKLLSELTGGAAAPAP